jgi:hypothetical protein
MSKLFAYIAALGQSIQFVAFWAHLGVSGLLVILAYKLGFGPYMVGTILAGGAIKEYYFDARYENNPPQTFLDNSEDFVGWLAGVAVGLRLKG